MSRVGSPGSRECFLHLTFIISQTQTHLPPITTSSAGATIIKVRHLNPGQKTSRCSEQTSRNCPLSCDLFKETFIIFTLHLLPLHLGNWMRYKIIKCNIINRRQSGSWSRHIWTNLAAGMWCLDLTLIQGLRVADNNRLENPSRVSFCAGLTISDSLAWTEPGGCYAPNHSNSIFCVRRNNEIFFVLIFFTIFMSTRWTLWYFYSLFFKTFKC